MNQSWVQSVIRGWAAANIELRSGASAASINDIAQSICFPFPDDFIPLYLQMDGFDNWDWTPTMFSIWPMERILEEYDPDDKNGFIGFCDYLVNCHSLGFSKRQSGIFKYYGTGAPELIASSFTEAIHLINTDTDIIY